MDYKAKGLLVEKFEEQQITDTFKKREFVIETSKEAGGKTFKEQLKFQLVQDKCDYINDLETGIMVDVSFNLKGRRWEKDGKSGYFNSLDAWSVKRNIESEAAIV